ncbi:hypothetical protein B0H15DRAFT_944449 [Mycena belliarum]|uniref:Uncharacterized protein n=1 Tax=Mycena belliarum TaxID=1033014 RepID=A0AAD6UG04_9AGAR|nr:hypothetical protein B0H15DRAFT_944449 [Mycena belliae]
MSLLSSLTLADFSVIATPSPDGSAFLNHYKLKASDTSGVLILGILQDILVIYVLGAPSAAQAATFDIFRDQTRLLHDLAELGSHDTSRVSSTPLCFGDDLDQRQIVTSEQRWTQGALSDSCGFLYIRVTPQTVHDVSDVSLDPGHAFPASVTEVPVLLGPGAVSVGSMLACEVELFRADVPLPCRSTHLVYERIYGVNARLSIKFYRTRPVT